jgi:hypothetical protein
LNRCPSKPIRAETKWPSAASWPTGCDVSEGQQLALIGQDVDGFPASDLFTIGAIIESPVDLVKTRGVVMSIETASEFLAMPDQAHEIVIRGSSVEQADRLAREVAALPAVSEMEVLSWREAAPEFGRMIDMKDWFDLIFLAIVFVAAASGIANTSSDVHVRANARVRDAAGHRLAACRVVRMVLLESVLLGLMGVHRLNGRLGPGAARPHRRVSTTLRWQGWNPRTSRSPG